MKKIMLVVLVIQFYFAGSQSLHKLHRDLPCINKEFNIFAHVVFNENYDIKSKEEIESTIEYANAMFSPICISFKLCEIDTVRNYNFFFIETSIEADELATLFEVKNRINVYFTSGVLVGINIDGISNLYHCGPYFFGNDAWQLTHELGHFFGLKHTFEGGDELVNGSNCETAGDKICDTPADFFNVQFGPLHYLDYNCVFKALDKDANGEYYQPDVGNLMSYYPCPCGFTPGQYLKMAEYYYMALKKHW